MKEYPLHSTHRSRFCIFALLLCHGLALTAQPASTVAGMVPGAVDLASGLWEEAGNLITNQRYDHLYSWGKAWVVPNYGVIIDLGSTTPFVQWDGERFALTGIITREDGTLELLLLDGNTSGSRSFRQLLFTPQADGSARMDFIRADGSTFGELSYTRRAGPGMK
jgi:hypothetical protein